MAAAYRQSRNDGRDGVWGSMHRRSTQEGWVTAVKMSAISGVEGPRGGHVVFVQRGDFASLNQC